MATKPIPSVEKLRQLFRYNRMTGQLFWRVRTVDMFTDSENRSAAHKCKNWNAQNAGLPVGCVGPKGYLTTVIDGESYKVHRLIFKMLKGYEPAEIDHEDKCKLNNKIGNLKDKTHAKNVKNAKLQKNNKTGQSGVEQTRSGKYRVRLSVGEDRIIISNFSKREDAIKWRRWAQIKAGYHRDHGRPDQS